MQNYKLLDIDLRLFDGAAAPAGGEAGDGGQAVESNLPKAETRQRGSSRRARSGEFDNVVFGIQEDAPAADTTISDAGREKGQGRANKSGISTTSDTLEARRKAFDELIDGEYKDIYAEKFQEAFNRRFKDMKGMEQSLAEQKPVMDILMQKYKIADGDVSKLQKAIEQDDTYWEQAADEAGLTVDQYRAMQKLERENDALRKMQAREEGQRQAQEKLNRWYAEAEKLKETYPAFDFKTECENRDFLGLLRSGLSVKQAYELQHMDELKAAAERSAAQAAGEQVVAKLKSKASRPSENGTSHQSAAIVKNDVHSLTRAERAEIARRAARGDIIKF